MSDERDYVRIAEQYRDAVIAAQIPACRWVRLACERQFRDLQRRDWDYRFNTARANEICAFVECLPHIEGRWPTKNIVLEPWQCFILTTIFGWVDASGYRRFRKALIMVPRKNGKTTLAAAVGLYLLACDGEPGARVYSAATTRDQAKLCWSTAKAMAERTPAFLSHFGVRPLANSIAIEHKAAFFQPLSRDVDSLEGLNAHGAIIDELHAHKTREVFDVLDESTGARSQPLLFIISTEGENAAGVLAEQVNYAQLVLSGQHVDETYFGIIYTIDPEDDWTQEISWRKANPHYDAVDASGRRVLAEDLKVRFSQARVNPESQASFLTKRLNVRVGAGEAFFNMLAWDRLCKDPSLRIEDFYGEPCYMALDLASRTDLAAKILLFPRDGRYYVFGRYYLPEEQLERGNPNYDLYRGWVPQWITLTPGNIIDYEFIERDVLEDARNFELLEAPGVDPWNAVQFITRLRAQGIEVVEIPQRVPIMSDPMKELGALIVAGRVRHQGDPVLTWMMGNVVAKRDANDNVFPRKARDANKIDGAVALIMAMGRAMRRTASGPTSVYANPETAVI